MRPGWEGGEGAGAGAVCCTLNKVEETSQLFD